MEDINSSLNKALVRQGWQFGDKMSRIGHPYEWVDGNKQGYIYSAKGVSAILQAYSMFYEKYPTPKEIETSDFSEMNDYLKDILNRLLGSIAPFLKSTEQWQWHKECTALVRCQDYSCIKTFCSDLPKTGFTHLDLGPGLGSHAFYSLKAFNSRYIGVEANAHMYEVQRSVYRFLATQFGDYLDIIECENHSLSKDEISTFLKNQNEYPISHVPSWYFTELSNSSVDLVTATWMLNETAHAGLLWLMGHAMRTLKKGGYFYIRDSANLKPMRHQINYDQLLIERGFKQIARLDIKNRVDFYGVPRVYQKISDSDVSFDKLTEDYLGKFAITSHGGEYNQNLDKAPRTA